MVKKSKSDLDAFRDWAKTNSNAKKAFSEIDETAKAKPNDPARVAALKAINASRRTTTSPSEPSATKPAAQTLA